MQPTNQGRYEVQGQRELLLLQVVGTFASCLLDLVKPALFLPSFTILASNPAISKHTANLDGDG